jgi:hypothetical protein
MLEELLFRKIELWIVGLLVLLFTIFLGVWGFAIVKYNAFPYATLVRLNQFVEGHEQDKRSIFSRLKSELSFNPLEFEAPRKTKLISDEKFLAVESVKHKSSGKGIIAGGMKFFSNTKELKYFVVFGSFVFPEQEINIGSILIDTNGKLHRAWAIRPDTYEYLGLQIGLDVTATGDILTNTNAVLTSYNWCGEKNWEAPWSPAPDGLRRNPDKVDGYGWHHDIVAIDENIYTFVGSSLMTVDSNSGEILSKITAADLMTWARRSGLSIFDARRKRPFTDEDFNQSNLVNLFHKDPFHFNKADILTADDAGQYDIFEPGDILISLRELNLVVVARPSTKSIIWYRYGLTYAQHDATFNSGHIDVFDNNSSSNPPEPKIVRLSIERNEAETLFNLADWGMVMRAKGNFELEGNQLLVTDDDAGRMIYGTLDGDINFVFENAYRTADSESTNLQLRNATEISPELVRQFEAQCAL